MISVDKQEMVEGAFEKWKGFGTGAATEAPQPLSEIDTLKMDL